MNLRSEWDRVSLGSTVIPPDLNEGSATCTVKPALKTDKKSPAGKNGARTTIQGLEPAQVTITCEFSRRILTPMREIARVHWPPTAPQDLLHPNASDHSVSSLIVETVSGFEHKGGGLWSYTWEGSGFDLSVGKCGVLLLKGSKGPEVKRWQTFLAAQGYDPGSIDGVFGAATDVATRLFQAAESARVDGIVGPETFGKAAAHGYVKPIAACQSATVTPTSSTPATPCEFPEELIAEGLTGGLGSFLETAGKINDGTFAEIAGGKP